ncbi:MAG: 50S ribosomal protein L11 methyltransferase [Pseudomonadales bacterium]|nr:50S ribosomal protein L11 methyltransferase [Pseudomonadales bacterium]
MWQQLTLRVRSADAEPLEQQLLEAGAVSISYLDAEDQPVFQEEPGSTPLWDLSILLALFEADHDLDTVLGALKTNPLILNGETLQIEKLEDQAWERSWMQDFKPMQFGRRLWICPSWEAAPTDEAVTIMMDPGLAFGSGTHPTTGLCLEWLDQADLQGLDVIDYGCGSGVLAIAAALLGARQVIAVDNDPQAILATIDNSQRNNISLEQLHACLPEALPSLQADVLLANILAAPLQQLAGHFADLLKPGGHLILSGLLENQIDEVAAAYTGQFTLAEPAIEGDWVRLDGVRKA